MGLSRVLDAAGDCVTRAVGHAMLAATSVPEAGLRSYRDAFPERGGDFVSLAPRTGSVAGLDIPLALPIGEGWVEPAGTRQVIFRMTVRSLPTRRRAAALATRHQRGTRRAREVESVPAYARREVCLHVAAAVDAAGRARAAARPGDRQTAGRLPREVDRTVHTWRAAAEEVGRIHGETVPLDVLPNGAGLIGFWQRKPIGVVVGIAGYNYPLFWPATSFAPRWPPDARSSSSPRSRRRWRPQAFARVREALQGASASVVAAQLVTGGAEVGQVPDDGPPDRCGLVHRVGRRWPSHRAPRPRRRCSSSWVECGAGRGR